MKKSVLLFLVGFTILTGCGKVVDENQKFIPNGSKYWSNMFILVQNSRKFSEQSC